MFRTLVFKYLFYRVLICLVKICAPIMHLDSNILLPKNLYLKVSNLNSLDFGFAGFSFFHIRMRHDSATKFRVVLYKTIFRLHLFEHKLGSPYHSWFYSFPKALYPDSAIKTKFTKFCKILLSFLCER